MNENLNLCEILKDCPTGTKLWSPIWGDVYFDRTYESDWFYIKVPYLSEEKVIRPNGYLWNVDSAECIIFPSKDQRDWSKFKAPVKRFNPEEFKPFDKVLVRNGNGLVWFPSLFDRILKELTYEGTVVELISGKTWGQCIPYNDETKHLLRTSNDCTEYYKWWKK